MRTLAAKERIASGDMGSFLSQVQADQAEMTDRQSHEMTEGARRNTIKDMEKSVSDRERNDPNSATEP